MGFLILCPIEPSWISLWYEGSVHVNVRSNEDAES